MNRILNRTLWVITIAIFLTGCEKKEVPPEAPEFAPALTVKINSFIKSAMSDVYLWYKNMPNLDIRYEFDSEEYFDKLLYKDDKWSFITDDITALENSFQGVEKSYGYSLALGIFVDNSGNPTGNYFAIVEYVHPETPAATAGFQRGDLIIKISSANITQSNYTQLFSGNSITVTKGILTQSGISTGATVSMTAEVLSLDPVLMYKVIERSGHKIGYMIYLQYISNYDNTSLRNALQHFKDNQITDLVLDLRYNPGGTTSSAQYLCSSLAPLSAVNDNKTLVTYQWNDKYQAYWNANGYTDQLEVRFRSDVPVKLGLNKIHILTSSGTASASELTICGLEPYMDVKLIGDSTYGKYTASITIKPEHIYQTPSEYTDFKNWGIQPIVLRFANSEGVTSFTKGFGPDFPVKDELLPAVQLGEITEPLLKKAIEDITGEIITKKGISEEYPFRFIQTRRVTSRFDEQKRNLFIDLPPELNIREIK
jgi:C-terminal processing protease CtpA/Prc